MAIHNPYPFHVREFGMWQGGNLPKFKFAEDLISE